MASSLEGVDKASVAALAQSLQQQQQQNLMEHSGMSSSPVVKQEAPTPPPVSTPQPPNAKKDTILYHLLIDEQSKQGAVNGNGPPPQRQGSSDSSDRLPSLTVDEGLAPSSYHAAWSNFWDQYTFSQENVTPWILDLPVKFYTYRIWSLCILHIWFYLKLVATELWRDNWSHQDSRVMISAFQAWVWFEEIWYSMQWVIMPLFVSCSWSSPQHAGCHLHKSELAELKGTTRLQNTTYHHGDPP